MLFLYVSYNFDCLRVPKLGDQKQKKCVRVASKFLSGFSFLNCSFYVLLLENSIRTHLFLMQFVWGFAARKIIRKRF